MNPRVYQMAARAEAAELTGARILDAMLQSFAELPLDRIRLDDVASRAGVTTQTVIRRFGGKDQLMVAMVGRELETMMGLRELPPDAAAPEVFAALVDHYERYGDLILKFYSEAHLVDGLGEIAVAGHARHLLWCREAFDAHLTSLPEVAKTRRVAQLAAICDVSVWRVLRHDGGLGRDEIELALIEMADPLLAGHPRSP